MNYLDKLYSSKEFSQEAYEKGASIAKNAEFSPSNCDRLSFVATLKLPIGSRPLNIDHFFSHEDMLHGFYSTHIDKLKTMVNNLSLYNAELREKVGSLTQQVYELKQPPKKKRKK